MRSCCKGLVATLACLVLAGAAQAQTTLRYKFKEGDKLGYAIKQDQKMSMNVMGMDIDMKTTMDMDMSWQTVKVEENGTAQAKVTLNHVKMTMEGGPLGKVEVDSTDKNEPDNPIAQVFAGIAKSIGGMEMTFTVDPTGDIKDVKISEGTQKKLKKIPGLGAFGGDAFGPDSLKALVEGGIIVPLPKDAVEKGKSWTQKVSTKTAVGKISGETKFTYDGATDKDLEKFTTKPDMKVETDANAPIQMKLKSGSGKGTTLFDNKAGRVAQATNEATMKMEIEAGGMTIDVTSTQTTTVRLKGPEKSKSPGDQP
jgi:hypothetical protein